MKCATRVLTQALTAKLDKFARKYYRIMFDICQAETHMTNTDLYLLADEHPISEMICECQLQFTGHCLHMPKNECQGQTAVELEYCHTQVAQQMMMNLASSNFT